MDEHLTISEPKSSSPSKNVSISAIDAIIKQNEKVLGKTPSYDEPDSYSQPKSYVGQTYNVAGKTIRLLGPNVPSGKSPSKNITSASIVPNVKLGGTHNKTGPVEVIVYPSTPVASTSMKLAKETSTIVSSQNSSQNTYTFLETLKQKDIQCKVSPKPVVTSNISSSNVQGTKMTKVVPGETVDPTKSLYHVLKIGDKSFLVPMNRKELSLNLPKKHETKLLPIPTCQTSNVTSSNSLIISNSSDSIGSSSNPVVIDSQSSSATGSSSNPVIVGSPLKVSPTTTMITKLATPITSDRTQAMNKLFVTNSNRRTVLPPQKMKTILPNQLQPQANSTGVPKTSPTAVTSLLQNSINHKSKETISTAGLTFKGMSPHNAEHGSIIVLPNGTVARIANPKNHTQLLNISSRPFSIPTPTTEGHKVDQSKGSTIQVKSVGDNSKMQYFTIRNPVASSASNIQNVGNVGGSVGSFVKVNQLQNISITGSPNIIKQRLEEKNVHIETSPQMVHSEARKRPINHMYIKNKKQKTSKPTVLTTCLQTAQGSVPVNVIAPGLDDDDYEEDNLNDREDNEETYDLSNISPHHDHDVLGQLTNSHKNLSNSQDLPLPLNYHEGLPLMEEDGGDVEIQTLHSIDGVGAEMQITSSETNPDQLGPRIESIFSLVNKEDYDSEATDSFCSLNESTDKTDIIETVNNLPSFNVQDDEWRHFLVPCFTVLDRLSKNSLADGLKSDEPQVKCSDHCRKRHLDSLCHFGLLVCNNHPDLTLPSPKIQKYTDNDQTAASGEASKAYVSVKRTARKSFNRSRENLVIQTTVQNSSFKKRTARKSINQVRTTIKLKSNDAVNSNSNEMENPLRISSSQDTFATLQKVDSDSLPQQAVPESVSDLIKEIGNNRQSLISLLPSVDPIVMTNHESHGKIDTEVQTGNTETPDLKPPRSKTLVSLLSGRSCKAASPDLARSVSPKTSRPQMKKPTQVISRGSKSRPKAAKLIYSEDGIDEDLDSSIGNVSQIISDIVSTEPMSISDGIKLLKCQVEEKRSQMNILKQKRLLEKHILMDRLARNKHIIKPRRSRAKKGKGVDLSKETKYGAISSLKVALPRKNGEVSVLECAPPEWSKQKTDMSIESKLATASHTNSQTETSTELFQSTNKALSTQTTIPTKPSNISKPMPLKDQHRIVSQLNLNNKPVRAAQLDKKTTLSPSTIQTALNSLSQHLSKNGKAINSERNGVFLLQIAGSPVLIKLPQSDSRTDENKNSMGNGDVDVSKTSHLCHLTSASTPLSTSNQVQMSTSPASTNNRSHTSFSSSGSNVGFKNILSLGDKSSVQIQGNKVSNSNQPQPKTITIAAAEHLYQKYLCKDGKVAPSSSLRLISNGTASPLATSTSKNVNLTSRQQISISQTSTFTTPSGSTVSLLAPRVATYDDKNSALSHVPVSSSLLPQRKSVKPISEAERIKKRKLLEAKYPLPPGVIIKCEPIDETHRSDDQIKYVEAVDPGPSQCNRILSDHPRHSDDQESENVDVEMVEEVDSNEHVETESDAPPLLYEEVASTLEKVSDSCDDAPPVLQPQLYSAPTSPENHNDYQTPGPSACLEVTGSPATTNYNDTASLMSVKSPAVVKSHKPNVNPKIQHLKDLLEKRKQEIEKIKKMSQEESSLDLSL